MKFSINSNVRWKIDVEIIAGEQWLKVQNSNEDLVTTLTGANSADITLVADENRTGQRREANIIVTNIDYDEKAEFKVEQSAGSYMLQYNLVDSVIGRDKGSKIEFNINSNVEWKIEVKKSLGEQYVEEEENVDWIEIEGGNIGSNGKDGIKLVATESNEALAHRKARVWIVQTSEPREEKRSFVITQRGQANLELSAKELTFTVIAGEKEQNDKARGFDVQNCNVSWEVSSDQNWLKVISVPKDSANATVKLGAEQNTGAERRATVSVKWVDGLGKDSISKVVVIQEAYPNVTDIKSTVNFTADGANSLEQNVIESTIGEQLTMKFAPKNLSERWNFEWNVAGTVQSTTGTDLSFTPNEKKSYPVTVTVSYKDDPSIVLGEYSYTLYPAPKAPVELIIKGQGEKKGSSGVAIARMDTKFESDFAGQYEYVFGGDMNANGSTTPNRYFQYNGNVSEPWVCTQWTIDGRTIRSNPINGNFTVGNTRGLSLARGHLLAHLDTPAPASIAVLSLRGTVVKRINLDARTDFDEDLDLSGLQSGMYMLRCTIGEQSADEKVIVK